MDFTEDEYWYEAGFSDGFLGKAHADELIIPLMFRDSYHEGYEDGAFEYADENLDTVYHNW